jgi:hypothetical protein
MAAEAAVNIGFAFHLEARRRTRAFGISTNPPEVMSLSCLSQA